MKNQIPQIMRRARRWKFEAGTTELMLGGIFFSSGLALVLPKTPMFALVVFIPGLFLTGSLVDILQRRYIFPRIGYIEYRENTGKGLWNVALWLILTVVILGGVMTWLFKYEPENALAWVTPLTAAFICVVLVPEAIQLRLWRLVVIGLISAGIGILFSPFILGSELTAGLFGLHSLGTYFLAMGIVFLFTGSLTFRNYLHNYSVPVETSNE